MLALERDYELIKKILLEFEKLPLNHKVDRINVEGYDSDNVIYHTFLLYEANLVKIIDTSSFEGRSFLPQRLTWEGHEFLDKAKNEKVWKSTLVKLKNAGVSVSFPILSNVLTEALNNLI